jgi:hypothetical protein
VECNGFALSPFPGRLIILCIQSRTHCGPHHPSLRRSRDVVPPLAFAAHLGIHVSADRPRDIRVHPRDNDLVIGTHGRGIFILDDASPLQQLASAHALALRVGERELRGTVRVEPDPRVQLTAADYQAQLEAALLVREQLGRVNAILDEAESIRLQLRNLTQLLERNGAAQEERAAVESALDEVSAFVEDDITRPPPRMNYRQYPRLREELTSLLGQIQNPQAPPTTGQLLRVQEVRADADSAQTQLDAIVDGTISRLNERLGTWPRVVTKRVMT